MPPLIPAFNTTGSATASPLYALLNNTGLKYPAGASCGPSGYGFGCALALYTATASASTTLGNGMRLGAPNALSAISASTKQSSFCVTPNTAPMPRPYGGAMAQAFIVLMFYM